MMDASRSGAPGVYVEWLDASSMTLDIGRTDVAGLLGIAQSGPFNTAVKIESAQQFQTAFGDPIEGGLLAYAVEGFLSNGGRTCWVVRVGDTQTAQPARLRVQLPGGACVVLEATSPGVWGNAISIEPVWGRDGIVAVDAVGLNRTQRIELKTAAVAGAGSTSTLVCGRASNLPELDPGDLVQVAPWTNGMNSLPPTPLRSGIYLSGGHDGLNALKAEHFTGNPTMDPLQPWGMDVLDRVDGISFVAAPDLMSLGLTPDGIKDAQFALISRCATRRDRIAILDVPPMERDAAMAYRVDFPDTGYAALYYPWISVDDPLRLRADLRTIPPSGHVAGMFARTDRMRGVHKAPANELLEGVWDLSRPVDATAHAQLNDNGINAIRVVPGRGVLVLGARTVSRDPRWRYINVRRLFSMIEEALDEQMQWLTFEPNARPLWRDVDRAVRSFLERLYAAGMLDGATADDAFFVRCDETTNPPSAIDEGRVVCEMGIQPPYPAEFVLVRIGLTRSGIQIEEKGAQDG